MAKVKNADIGNWLLNVGVHLIYIYTHTQTEQRQKQKTN